MNLPHRKAILTALGCLLVAGRSFGSGYDGPSNYLGNGSKNTVTSPEFFWDLEVKRLAKDYHPTEKPFPIARAVTDDNVVDRAPLIKGTADADAKDFADAIKTGEIKPADAAAATKEHSDARAVISQLATANVPLPKPDLYGPTPTPSPTPAPTKLPQLPTEEDSEFADYNRGAYAYQLGKAHWDEAEKAWKDLLNRPEAERHYRTVWAAFMLGKLALLRDDPHAVDWFQKTRELAKAGFADSLGMAADSYGWEGRSEWKQGHPDKAAPLFLTQLALGDESAVVSLKALIPDREAVDSMENYGPDAPTDQPSPSPTPSPAEAAKMEAALKVMAENPLLRRLETVHILSVDGGAVWEDITDSANSKARLNRWLKIIEGEKLGQVEDAEYLGWLAYGIGDFPGAQSWLKLSSGSSAMALWLDAKLQLRAGKLDLAAKDLSQVIERIQPDAYTNWAPGPFKISNVGYVNDEDYDGENWSQPQRASGDLGATHLARGDFIQALDVLVKGDLWLDAAFVAERVLTVDELKTYVDKLPPPPPPTPTPAPDANDENDTKPDHIADIRYLLGRRLVREDRYDEAIHYLPAPYDKICAKYAQALKTGNDTTSPADARARALFTAAWIARFDGLELMGTEVAPDGFESQGDFPEYDYVPERIKGEYAASVTDASGNTKTQTEKNALPTTPEEIKRLKTNVIDPDKRWHYRYIAAGLAIKAAHLMADNTEELADVVNTAGSWMKTLDEKKADTYYQLIEQHCSKTKIGKADIAAHWFVDQPGPWSTKEGADNDALTKTSSDANSGK